MKRVLPFVFALFVVLATGAENLNTWQKQMPITFSGYAPPGGGETLTNFPALVILSNTTAGIGFDYADFLSPPYGDLRFAAADKTTPLDFEVESWDTNGLSYVWVRVPELTNNLTIHAFWGRNGVDAPACTTNGAVWTEGFVGVWHMSQTNAQDSTVNRAHADAVVAVANAVGQIDGADAFNGSSSYINVTNIAALESAQVTFSAWLKVTGNGSHSDGNYVLTKGRDGVAGYMSYSIMHKPSDGKLSVNVSVGSQQSLDDTAAVTSNTFVHVAGTYQSGSFKFYRDGILRASSALSGAISYAMVDHNLHLGDWGYSSWTRRFQGVIDEVRVSSVIRSSNWVWASYMNMASNNVFNTYGTPKYGGAPGIINSNAVVGATYVTLNGYLVSTGFDANVSACVFWGTNDAGATKPGWGHTNFFPVPATIGLLSTNVVPTVAGAKHYYRFYATNSFGDAWASPAGIFAWQGAPSINNAGGAINVISSRATLQGEVTGGYPSPNVYIYWGATDGGVNKTLWEHETPVGVVSNWTFSAIVSLTPGLTYYYRCYASNTYGDAWAPATTNFVATIHSKTWNGAGTNALASNPINWVGNVAPIAWDDIQLDVTTNKTMTWDLNIMLSTWTQIGYTGTVTVATVYSPAGFTNLNIAGNCIISNGVWTHIANSGSETYRLSATIGGDLVVGSNAIIAAIGLGYPNNAGPGGSFASGTSGGAHGGRGAGTYGTSLIGKNTYGSVTRPTRLGSGGTSGRGGGAILLTVAGQACIDGRVTSKGADVGNYAGSGGSTWLIARELAGSGRIDADGGHLIPAGFSRGGGGRTAVWLTGPGADFSVFTGVISAYGGAVTDAEGNLSSSSGGPGTVYLKEGGDSNDGGELIVDNGGRSTYSSWYQEGCAGLGDLETATYEFRQITLRGNGRLNVCSNNTLIITNTIIKGDNSGAGLTMEGGIVVAPDVFVYSNYFISVRNVGITANFSPAQSLTLGTNAVLYVDQPHVLGCNVTLESGCRLTHSANLWFGATYGQKLLPETSLNRLILSINGNLLVQDGGSVDVSGRGYPGPEGPGRIDNGDYGGSYGGRGGGLYKGGCYGSIRRPVSLGTGGSSAGLVGGGAIVLTVSGAMTNNGVICADGTGGANWAAAPAGGAVSITAGTLAGNGAISAAGGLVSGYGTWAGGGGRIALTVTNAGADFVNYTGPVQAFSGRRGATAYYAGAGTVYLRTSAQAEDKGVLIVDDGGVANTRYTEIGPDVTDASVGHVLIRNAGYLLLATNQTITVSGIWSNSASFEGYSDSAVIFAGGAGSTSTVCGSTIFKGLVCTNAGKTVLFESGSTNSVQAQGRLLLKGDDAASVVTLRPSAAGVWKLNANATANQSVSYVDVANSDASGGAEIVAVNSVNSGGNTNWRFSTVIAGETNTWTGGTSTLWSASANWDLLHYPLSTDVILIPGGLERYPVLDGPSEAYCLTIASGASLALNGYDLTVTSNLLVAGSLIASAEETVTLQKNVDFSGGAFIPVFSTVVFSGAGDQAVNPAGQTFFKILVLNSAGTVTFGDGFTATELRCEAPGGARNIVFQQGSAVVLRDLVLLGSTASTNIILRSSSSGGKWNLAVSGYRWAIQGVDVRDSDASGGLPIPAAFSKDSGNNLNWLFNETRSIWLGTNSVNFHTAANWLSGVVPGATSRVLVDSANPMSITGAVTLLDLTVGGGVGSASMTAYAPLTVIEDMVILTNGTLALNRPSVVSNGLYVLAGGMLTHSGSQITETNRLELIIDGDVVVDLNGAIDVTAKGYRNGYGPGYITYYVNCGSYGGRASGPCYGSIIAPTNLGSGGAYASGGGAILLTVYGTIRNDGLVCADGAQPADYGAAASGGSIWLTSGILIGSGTIQANGGNGGGSGGGRISLVVTKPGADFSTFNGVVHAYSGVALPAAVDAKNSGAGTIYRQIAANWPGRGTVLIDNNNFLNTRYTDVPPNPPNFTNEVEFTPFHITNSARMRLTNDFMVGDFYLDSTNTWLDLGFNTLTIRSREHELGPGVVTNLGAIIWWPDIPKGIVFSVW